ncbi:MAG: AprI/Inh family metalloprotease inhibitor [Xanthobacteraceae bacterium]
MPPPRPDGPRVPWSPWKMFRFRLVPSCVVLFGVVAAPGLAAAQTPTDAAKAMVGAWELSNADRDKTCTVNFKLGTAGPTYGIDLEKKCGETFPGIRGIVGWTFGRNDSLLLVDAGGKPVLELLEVEAGMYEGLRPNEGRYLLQNAAVAAASRDRPADDMFGEWSFVRGSVPGKPICALTLANTAADAENFAINVKPGCDAQIARFGPTSWRMDRGQLVLQSGKGELWRFEENDPNTWDRIPRGRLPLTLVRQEKVP